MPATTLTHICACLGHRDNFTRSVAALREQLLATEEALEEAVVILELISSRNFTAAGEDLQQYEMVAMSSRILAVSLLDSITFISEQVID